MGMTIIIALVTFVVGGLLVWFVMRVLMKSRYDAVIREAENGVGSNEAEEAARSKTRSSFI